jgi:hypothetical protein
MQQQLVKNGNLATPQSLIITKAGKQKLSKNQEAFNKLTQKIEKLQKEITKKQLQFDLALKIYGAELYPAQLKILENRRMVIIILWDVYITNKLSKTAQRHLKNIVQYHLQEYFTTSDIEPDEVLQNIFSAVEGISYDKMMEDEKAKEITLLQEMLAKMNVDIKGVDINDEAAMAQKIAEAKKNMEDLQARQQERQQQWQQKKKKTAKQAENERMQQAINEMKQKNISTIYKQLAKLFHPDLEQDIEKKVEKEILMKELTAAYEAKNLHALLMLELKWIHKENAHLETLTDEKLAIYLEILKEQARDLEREKICIFQQPQYYALVNQFGYTVQRYPVEIVRKHINKATAIAKEFEMDITDLKSDTALRHIKEMIKQWKQNQKQNDEDEEIMRMFFDR